MFKYGEKVRDVITGYTGKVTARVEYYGRSPVQFRVEGIDRTGRPIEEWVDEGRLEPVKTDCVCIPRDVPQAELVEEVPLGRTKEELESQLSAMLNAKA